MAKAPTTIGLHGYEILSLLYRFGALTINQVERLTGLHYAIAKRQLGYLVDAGYVSRTRDVAGWVSRSRGRTPTAHYLNIPQGAKTGSFALGIENDILALKNYRRVRLPGTIYHRLLGNEYLITVSKAGSKAAKKAKKKELKVKEIYSESCPDFPLFGSGIPKTGRADTRYQFARIVPDGTFVFNSHTYLLEVETGTVAHKEFLKDISNYAGRWRRLLTPNKGERKFHNPDARLEPLIILTPTDQHKPLRDYLRKHLPDAEDWRAGDKAIREASGGKAQAGQLIIVAGMEEVSDEPLSRSYRPLYKYPPECSGP